MADTIVALSSAAGKAGVAVVRISGAAAGAAIRQLTGELPAPRTAVVRKIADPLSGDLLDRGLILWFPAPRSFTGEDVAEFQVHGSRAVVAGLIESLCGIDGIRPADPGEFTRRSFENGKMDLSRVEGLADLIDAETAAQRSQALRQMEGAFAEACRAWGAALRRCLAWLEAAIDFPDEDVPDDLFVRVRPDVAAVRDGIDRWLAAPDRGRVIRDGFHIAIVGRPNVGKSSLLNALARRDVAIVSERAGTTRDVIEVRMDIGGYPVVLADTAGIREAGETDETDGVEAEGIRRALSRSSAADLVIDVRSLAAPDRPAAALAGGADHRQRHMIVYNKADLFPPTGIDGGAIGVSAKTGAGIPALLSAIHDLIERDFATQDHPALTRERHRRALRTCRVALGRAMAATDAELYAEDLRLALRSMDRLIGKTGVEDLLDMIFRDFCIGK